MTRTQTAAFIIALALGIGYIAWLSTGCVHGVGYMTWQGKTCASV